MSFQIPTLDLLVHELTKLPGVGEKSAQRFALHILKSGSGYSEKLRQALELVETKIVVFPQCFSYTEPDFKICRAKR
jgi:recombination protein RecR